MLRTYHFLETGIAFVDGERVVRYCDTVAKQWHDDGLEHAMRIARMSKVDFVEYQDTPSGGDSIMTSTMIYIWVPPTVLSAAIQDLFPCSGGRSFGKDGASVLSSTAREFYTHRQGKASQGGEQGGNDDVSSRHSHSCDIKYSTPSATCS
jgi:hypothetical protein